MPAHDLPLWVYFVSRDSLNGELLGTCSLWIEKPVRVKHRGRVTWVAADERNPGHLGDFKPLKILRWFRVFPETDRELIRVETYPSARELEEAKKAAR